MKKVLILILPFLLLGAEKPSVEQLFNVQTVKVQKVTTTFEKSFYGLIKADERLVTEVVPRFGGYVVKLYADTTFEEVKKGEILAKVYSPQVYKAKEEYLNSLNFLKKRGDSNMVESARRKLLLLGVDKKEIDAVKAKGRVDPYTTLRAPSRGFIFEKSLLQGSAFKAKSSLFKIVGLQRVWIEAKVSEPDLPLLYEAKSFEVETKAVKGRLKAKKPVIYPTIDRKSALATIRAEIENPTLRLMPGMFATLFAKSEKETLLTLPRSAVIRKMGSWYVFKAGEFEGEYEPVEVEVKPLDNENYAILSGLEEGDEVVGRALFLIDSDAQINGLF